MSLCSDQQVGEPIPVYVSCCGKRLTYIFTFGPLNSDAIRSVKIT